MSSKIGLLSASTNFSEGRMEGKEELDHYIGVATTKESPADLSLVEQN
jgi:AraC family transcriptional regulator